MENTAFSPFITRVYEVLAMNSVRAKPIVKKRSAGLLILKVVGVAAIVIALATAAYDGATGYFGFFPQHFETIPFAGGKIIKVPPGANLQSAIDQAASGDIVELQAGAVYSGQINLKNKPLTDYITIRSSRAAELPEDKRVSPAQQPMMAVIQSGMLGRAAVSAANGAHHYRFVGIEFTMSGTMYNYGLVELGRGETRPENVPHDIEIDRCYLHPKAGGVSRRGIALNSADTVIKNSYIEGFAGPQEEAQGICGWSGTRNVKITNNYIEGGAENIMFGGSDPANAELIPTGIEITGNYLYKPKAWKKKFTTKTLFELKNAKKVRFSGNYLENNWDGSAFRITVRDQDGKAAFSVIEDAEISGNIINGAGEGINILGKDDTYPSQTLKHLTISNNIFLDLGGPDFDGSGYFIQIADGDGVTIEHNTVFNKGNIVTFYGTMPQNFIFRDNIVGHGNYGVHGPIDLNASSTRQMFTNNVIVNDLRLPKGDLAVPGDTPVADSIADVGFINIEEKDLRLSPKSKYKGKGSNGSDPGANITYFKPLR